QRALCTILVAATLAACSAPAGPRPSATPLAAPPVRIALVAPDLTRGVGGGKSMGFYISTCLYQPEPGADCLNLVFRIGQRPARPLRSLHGHAEPCPPARARRARDRPLGRPSRQPRRRRRRRAPTRAPVPRGPLGYDGRTSVPARRPAADGDVRVGVRLHLR